MPATTHVESAQQDSGQYPVIYGLSVLLVATILIFMIIGIALVVFVVVADDGDAVVGLMRAGVYGGLC